MNDLKLIKQYYGEEMMHLCRELFPTILEQEGVLYNVIDTHFAHYRFLAHDIIKNNLKYAFKDYIYNLIDIKKELKKSKKSAKELLKEEGYELFECRTEEEIQAFKKYYEEDERLCTFKGDRLNTNYVFFAVRKNAEKLKRTDFNDPRREDEYGTSVISIQFTRGKINNLSIKNRYNHKVKNPDATFCNNLENIKEGLTKAFEKDYELNINQNNSFNFELPNYVKASDLKYYKYNYEIDNVYYGPNNIIIDNFNVVKKYLQKEKYLIIDYFILDLVNKKIMLHKDHDQDEYGSLYEIFDSFTNLGCDIDNIIINKDSKTKEKIITIKSNNKEDIIIKIDRNNNIIEYKNSNLKIIEDDFLYYNEKLKFISIPNVEIIKSNFLYHNIALREINLDSVKQIGNCFMNSNVYLNKISMLNIKTIKDNFLDKNLSLEYIDFPSIISIGSNFISNNKSLKKVIMKNLKAVDSSFLRHVLLKDISFPSLIKIGNKFMDKNFDILEVYLPSLKTVKDDFFKSGLKLESINFPNLEVIGNNFLQLNRVIKNIELPNVKVIGHNFIENGGNFSSISFPSLIKVGDKFLNGSIITSEIFMPYLKIIGNSFMSHNNKIKYLDLPNVESIKDNFLMFNKVIEQLFLPRVKYIKNGFLKYNNTLNNLYITNVEIIKDDFLSFNNQLKYLDIRNAKSIGDGFMDYNESLLALMADNLEYIGDDFLKKDNTATMIYTPNLKKVGNNALKNNKVIQLVGKEHKVLNKRLSFYISKLFIPLNVRLKVQKEIYKIYNDINLEKSKVLTK